MNNPNSHKYKKEHNQLVYSYLTMRKLLGYLGILTPIILYFSSAQLCGCTSPQRAISHFYHTCVQDIFIVIAGAISFFLLIYKGYDWIDHLAFKIAGIGILGLALFPTDYRSDGICTRAWEAPSSTIGDIHNVCAVVFFLSITLICLFLFTKSNHKQMTEQKRKRNLVFKICGTIMLLCLGAILALNFEIVPVSVEHDIVFYLQSVALFVFGVAWLVKGQAIYRDPPQS